MRSHRSAKSIFAAFVFMVGLNACVKKLPPPPPPPPPPPAQSRASAGQGAPNQPAPARTNPEPPKGFWNAKDAPEVVSKIENWTYAGVYFPAGANGPAARVLIVGAMAMATGNLDGTTHWWGFTVQQVVPQNQPGRELSFDVEDEKLSANANRPVIVLEGKYRLVPVGGNAATLSFQQLTTP